MSLLTNKRIVLAKIESSYGEDSAPNGSNAMLVKNLNFNPLQAEQVDRDLSRPYFGNSEKLLATLSAQIDFEIELAGAGAAGQVPAYDCLLRACAFVKEIKTASVSIVVASGIATVTHTAHGYSGAGNKITIAGATETELNGIKEITVVNANTYTFTTLEDDGAAAGTIVCQTGVEYKPISSDIESVTINVIVDSVLHKAIGSRGTVEFAVNVKQIPVMRFSFIGLYTPPTDSVAPAADFTGFKIPKIANTQNTPGFSLFGGTANLESANFNVSNDVQYVSLIGEESVKILNRKPAGSFVFEAPTMAQKNYFEAAANTEVGEMILEHGVKAGEKVKVSCPSVNLGNPNYQDSNGTQMLNAPFTANPDQGNDEIVILVA